MDGGQNPLEGMDKLHEMENGEARGSAERSVGAGLRGGTVLKDWGLKRRVLKKRDRVGCGGSPDWKHRGFPESPGASPGKPVQKDQILELENGDRRPGRGKEVSMTTNMLLCCTEFQGNTETGNGKQQSAFEGVCGWSKLPPSVHSSSKEEDMASESVFPASIYDVLKAFPGRPNQRLEKVDILEIAAMKGIAFPPPRWWRPGGYGAKEQNSGLARHLQL